MKRLLDTSVFITAKNRYYAFDIVPVFWEWLESEAEIGSLASIDLVFDELSQYDDELTEWAKQCKNTIFNVPSNSKSVNQYINHIHSWALNAEFEQHVISDFMDKADPFLIAVAADMGYTVVTEETAAPNSRRSIKIPDVCRSLDVPYENTFNMMRNLRAKFT